MKRKILNLGISLVGPIALIVMLTMPIGPLSGGLGIIAPTGGVFDVGYPESALQTINLPGLDANVEVRFDEWGIPHIYADAVTDAYMALGYLHAKERLFQMVMQNYLAAGRICEIVGSYAVSSDRYYRAIGLARGAEETYQWYLANRDTNDDVAYVLDIIDAEVAGVNAFIDSMTSSTTPIEFKILGFTPQYWRPVDVFIWTKMMSWSLVAGADDLYREYARATIANNTMYDDLFPDLMPYNVPIMPEQHNLSLTEYPNSAGGFPADPAPPPTASRASPSEDLIPTDKLKTLLSIIDDVILPIELREAMGSNSWAVSSSLSETGSPILANDPHLPLQAPSLWYEAHLVAPGTDVMGVSFPGIPGFVLGHGDHIAWGMTAAAYDVMDFFVEQVNPDNESQYWYNGAWREFEVVDETIHTKDVGDIIFDVKWSVHGPCIDSVMGTYNLDSTETPNIAMNWTGLDITHEILALLLLNKAKNLEDYYDALYWWDSPPHNFIYADDEGHIAITAAGRYPLRTGYIGDIPIQALNDSVGMVSNIPYAYIPRSVDPAQGYLQSANQRSYDPETYGWDVIGPYATGYRGRRINYLLNTSSSISMDDMKKWQADSVDVSAQEIVPYVIDAWNAAGDGNATVQLAVDWLSDWDFSMETDIQAPTTWRFLVDALKYEIFDELRVTLDANLRTPSTPVLERVIKENEANYLDDHSTGEVETRDEILAQALFRALDEMVLKLGSNMTDWYYGNFHVTYFDHLASLTVIGGDPHRGWNTLNRAVSYWDNDAGQWRVVAGPSWRMVIDMGDIEHAYGVYTGGQSGNMFSQHWDDIYDIWYAYDEETEQYGYHLMRFYPTLTSLAIADLSEHFVERMITFVP